MDFTCRSAIFVKWIKVLEFSPPVTVVHRQVISQLPSKGQAGLTFELVRQAEACSTVFLCFCPSFPPMALWSLIFHTGAEDSWPSAPLPPLAPWQLYCKVHIPNHISIPLLPHHFSQSTVSPSLLKSSTLFQWSFSRRIKRNNWFLHWWFLLSCNFLYSLWT